MSESGTMLAPGGGDGSCAMGRTLSPDAMGLGDGTAVGQMLSSGETETGLRLDGGRERGA